MITCPAYFGTAEREATANAGRLAGLNVRAILNEPTAAAIAYGLEQGEDQTVLVYDLGGGTFDITMIEIKDRLIRVICTGGDHRLGGVLWDEAIVMYLAEQFRSQTGEASDPLDDPEVLNDLFLQAERGKKTLTQRDKAPFRVTHAGQQARVELDRDQVRGDHQAPARPDHRADARDARRRPRQGIHPKFDKIILVGGATRMPQVRNRLVAEFDMEPEIYDPDEAVAKGAALYAPQGVAARTRSRTSSRPGRRRRPRTGEAGRPGRRSPRSRWPRPSTTSRSELGFTLTGPVRELVNTRIVNVLSKSLGVVARDDKSQDVVVYLLPRNSEVPLERRRPTSAPTPPTRRPSTSA